MNIHGKRVRAAVAFGVALAGTVALGTSPASAKASDGWVRGYGAVTDDWSDEGVLHDRSRVSNAVCLWQKILWAEGVHKSGGKRFALSDVNGKFTYDTKVATKNLQYRFNLGADGVVGPATFGRADVKLSISSGSTAKGKKLYLTYLGAAHNFSIVRNTQGKYVFKDKAGDWRQAGYNYRTCAT
ncbi:peptidoglycan-binding protein [Streptomyces sp. NPDC048389]|uniref:peptidoglycan-binding domain-containing protein n=1 Tax=Streptomyces sp. NPDC048389 TaxID=3154622 RepID=UPI003451DC45